MVRLILDGFERVGFVLSPPRCVSCRCWLYQRTVFCATCDALVRPVVSLAVPLSGGKSLNVLAAAAYEGPVRRLVLQKRTNNIAGSRALAQLIMQRTSFLQIPCDYVVPVPLHWTRYWKRGFNQATEMAHILARHRSCPVASVVRRTRRTAYQADVSAAQRASNVADAFELCIAASKREHYRGRHVVLVDDLVTTGNTLKHTAQALLELEPASLTAIVACRAIEQ